MSEEKEKKDIRWWNDWTLFAYHFQHSTYITALWNWLLIFLSRAAEPFLFATVLYNGYKLLPGVPVPPTGLDICMFIGQQATLDIGGLGLIKQAQQKGGKRSFAYWLGIVLVGLMIANMVVASIEHITSLGDATPVIEGVLLVIRAIMAVLYGYAVHSLREDTLESAAVVKSLDVVVALATVTAALEKLTETQKHLADETLRQMTSVDANLLSVTEQIQRLESATERQLMAFGESHQSETERQFVSQQEAIALHVDGAIAPVHETLAAYGETLSVLPVLREQIAHLETLPKEEWQAIRMMVERCAEILPKVAQSIDQVSVRQYIAAPKPSPETRPKPVTERQRKAAKGEAPFAFDKREFILECLREDPKVSISVIQQKALLLGQSIATGYVSEVRTAFAEEQRAALNNVSVVSE